MKRKIPKNSFPKFCNWRPYTYNKVKTKSNSEGQEIHIEGKCSKKSGSSHIRYSPVSNVVFVNKKDPKLNNTEFNKYVFELQEEQGQKIF